MFIVHTMPRHWVYLKMGLPDAYDPAFHLKTYAQGPDVFHLEGSFLPDDLSLVPRFVMNHIG